MGKHSRLKPTHHQMVELTYPVTDAAGTGTHLLSNEAMAAGRRAKGRYRALCGVAVLPAPMTEGPATPCDGCWARTIPHPRFGRALTTRAETEEFRP